MNICDKILKVDDTITIKIVDNGYMFEISGQDQNADWKTVRIVCHSRSELDTLLDEALDMDRTE
jgi:hypothetical protein